MQTAVTLDQLPAWLASAVSKVWEDVQRGGRLPGLAPFANTGDPALAGMYWVGVIELSRQPRHAVSGIGVDEGTPRAEMLVAIADNIQNVISEFDGAWGLALPRCPLHAHPMAPVVYEGEAWWTCGVLSRKLGRIGLGELGSNPPGRTG